MEDDIEETEQEIRKEQNSDNEQLLQIDRELKSIANDSKRRARESALLTQVQALSYNEEYNRPLKARKALESVIWDLKEEIQRRILPDKLQRVFVQTKNHLEELRSTLKKRNQLDFLGEAIKKT